MAISVGTTRQKLADYYKTFGNSFGLATANPGPSATPDPTVTYTVQVATTWTPGTGGVLNGSACKIPADANLAYTFAVLYADDGSSMVDNCAIDSTPPLMSPGQIVLTPTYTQS
jgi:hypothetical protein